MNSTDTLLMVAVCLMLGVPASWFWSISGLMVGLAVYETIKQTCDTGVEDDD